MTRHKQIWMKDGLPLGVIALSLVAFFVLKATKPTPERSEKVSDGVLVHIRPLTTASHDASVAAKGRVMAAQKVMLQAELGGRVTWQSGELVPGGRFKTGEKMLKIDARDYNITADARRADLRRARLELTVENRRSDVAKQEWDAFGDNSSESEGSGLALRKPQLEAAKVQLKAAQGAVAKAELDLRRTHLRAPFNAMVIDENVDVGQLIGPQSMVATLVGTDAYWVKVPIPVRMMPKTRARAGDTPGSKVQITQTIGDQKIERQGEVIRHLPDLDPGGSMARILVSIADPLGQEGELPLLLGSFVDVSIEAGQVEDTLQVPRFAVHDGNRVYIMNSDRRLEVRDVEIVWSTQDSVFVKSGVKAGEQIVISRINTPIPNMLLRMANEAAPKNGNVVAKPAQHPPTKGNGG